REVAAPLHAGHAHRTRPGEAAAVEVADGPGRQPVRVAVAPARAEALETAAAIARDRVAQVGHPFEFERAPAAEGREQRRDRGGLLAVAPVQVTVVAERPAAAAHRFDR